MKLYRFEVTLADCQEISDDLAEALVVAGCDDGTPATSAGTARLGFSREAESLEAAIRLAIADVQKAGCRASSVRIDAQDLAETKGHSS